MAKQINVCISGAVKKVKKVPLCIGGAIKEAKKGVCCIDGVVKEFFSGWEFVFYDDNDGLATIGVSTNGTRFLLKSGKVESSAYFRIYGDLAGKEIVMNGIRDTDGSGGIRLYTAADEYLYSTYFKDETEAAKTYTVPEDKDDAYMEIYVSSGTTSQSRTTQITKLTVGGEDVLAELLEFAATYNA